MASVYAARYRAARAYADLSQEELAKRLGIDAQTIKRREAGSKDPKLGERIAVAAICGVPPEFMEHGWGTLQPSEIRELLDQQTRLLTRIEGAVSREDEIRRLLDESAKRTDQASKEALRRLEELQAAAPKAPEAPSTNAT